jgi:hypothetical protein
MRVKSDKDKARDRKNADEKRRILGEYKVKVGCVDCGYNAHPWALEFDHLPGAVKTRTVASMMYSSWDAIWAEVAKCEVVCANCHAIRTFTRKGA